MILVYIILDIEGKGDKNEDSKTKNQELQMVFNPARDDLSQVPYHIDGNPEMYTDENLKKRETLKNDPIVKESINDFINFFKKNKEGIITKDEYFRVFSKVFQILRPKADEDERNKCLKEDYDRDNDNPTADKIDHNKLYQSLYDMADIWCPNIDPNEIKEFFDILKLRFKNEGLSNVAAYDVLT